MRGSRKGSGEYYPVGAKVTVVLQCKTAITFAPNCKITDRLEATGGLVNVSRAITLEARYSKSFPSLMKCSLFGHHPIPKLLEDLK